MSNQESGNKRIAILSTDGFEQSELMKPRQLLQDAGFQVDVISLQGGSIRGWKDKDWGDSVPSTWSAKAPRMTRPLVAGGVINPDSCDGCCGRRFRARFDSRQAARAICHGPWCWSSQERSSQ